MPPPAVVTLCTTTSYLPMGRPAGTEGSGSSGGAVSRSSTSPSASHHLHLAGWSSGATTSSPSATKPSIPGSSTTTSLEVQLAGGVPRHRQHVGLLAHLRSAAAARPTTPTRRRRSRPPPPRAARVVRRGAGAARLRSRGLRHPRTGQVGGVGRAYGVRCDLAGTRRQAGPLADLGPERGVDLLVRDAPAPRADGWPAGSRRRPAARCRAARPRPPARRPGRPTGRRGSA